MDTDLKVVDQEIASTDLIFPRSTIKMIQLLPLMRKKAALKISSNPQEIACGCASHIGEKCHTNVVAQWLKRLHLSEDDLICGAHWPYDEATAHELIHQGKKASRLHNNCSGKHASQLELCQLLDAPIKNYHEVSHPVQKLIREEMQTLAEYKMKDDDWGIDGCGIPAWRMPFENFAKMMAQFTRQAAVAGTVENEVYQACVDNPVLTCGHGEVGTLIMQKMPGEIFVKVGAEGLMTAVLPALKKAIVLKVLDGNELAAEVAITNLILKVAPSYEADLASMARPVVKNWAGTPTGFYQV